MLTKTEKEVLLRIAGMMMVGAVVLALVVVTAIDTKKRILDVAEASCAKYFKDRPLSEILPMCKEIVGRK